MNDQQESLNSVTQSRTGIFNRIATLPDGRAIRSIDENTCEVTTYRGTPATDKQIRDAVSMLNISYPAMKEETFGILCSRWREEGWTAQRIIDAITHLIDTCRYPTFQIADIMSFDRPMKLYTYGGYCWLIAQGRASDADGCGEKSDFGKLKANNKIFFYLKKDVPSLR